MATKNGSITATGATRLGTQAMGSVGRWIVQLSGTWAATIKFEGIVEQVAAPAGGANGDAQGSGLTLASNATGIATTNITTQAVVSGATGVTANGLYWVDGSGMDVQIDCTAFTSGTIVWDAREVRG